MRCNWGGELVVLGESMVERRFCVVIASHKTPGAFRARGGFGDVVKFGVVDRPAGFACKTAEHSVAHFGVWQIQEINNIKWKVAGFEHLIEGERLADCAWESIQKETIAPVDPLLDHFEREAVGKKKALAGIGVSLNADGGACGTFASEHFPGGGVGNGKRGP